MPQNLLKLAYFWVVDRLLTTYTRTCIPHAGPVSNILTITLLLYITTQYIVYPDYQLELITAMTAHIKGHSSTISQPGARLKQSQTDDEGGKGNTTSGKLAATSNTGSNDIRIILSNRRDRRDGSRGYRLVSRSGARSRVRSRIRAGAGTRSRSGVRSGVRAGAGIRVRAGARARAGVRTGVRAGTRIRARSALGTRARARTGVLGLGRRWNTFVRLLLNWRRLVLATVVSVARLVRARVRGTGGDRLVICLFKIT